jgi:S1-C subfamily serine protease
VRAMRVVGAALLVVALGLDAQAETERPRAEIVGPAVLPELTALVAEAEPATAFVLAMDEFDQVLQGTGLVIRSDGWIATSYELVGWTSRIEAQVWVGGELRALPAQLVRAYPSLNLALLWVPAVGLRTLPEAPPEAVRAGATVIGLGYPSYNQLERGLRITRGRLSLPLQVESDSGSRIFVADLLYVSGLAGGAVCNPEGELVGVVIGTGPLLTGTTRVLAIADVRARVEAVAASYVVPAPGPSLKRSSQR